MPELSRFFGIIVRMYFNDHAPPHFHASYGEHEALIAIDSLSVVRGYLPRRALALAVEWALYHRDELWADWALAMEGKPLADIEPLE
jgi:hypothetical protein